jgi:SAM-dependent methyltransferase
MNIIPKIKSGACPVCAGTDMLRVMTIKDVPVYCNVLHSFAQSAFRAPRGDIVLTYCRQCGQIFNSAYDPGKMSYGREYENSLHYSPRFQEYASSLARRLIKKYGLYSKRVLEIGCGKGDFLNMLCEFGENSGIGFDPSYEKGRGPADSKKRFSVINDFYSEKYAEYPADLIVCRHVLEHIEAPRAFLNLLRRNMGSNGNTILFFEVPNIRFTVQQESIWDLIYEHYGYFSQASLSYLFNACDFIIHNIEESFGGQYICLEASCYESFPELSRDRINKTDNLEYDIRTFSGQYHSKVNEWQDRIKELEDSNKKVVVWGAGSKGISFLNQIKAKNLIKYIVDVNPHKYGKFIAGGGQEVVAPDFLQKYRPDVIIVMNRIYKKEILQYIRKSGLASKLVVA